MGSDTAGRLIMQAHKRLWLSCIIALLAGALATLSLPPHGVWPVLFVSYPVLVWLLDGAGAYGAGTRSARTRGAFGRGFAIGWSFAFGYFVPSLWWISEAFWVEPEKFAALIPFAVAGLPSYLALYWGLAGGLAASLWRTGVTRIFLLVVLLAIAEWLRGNMLTGFPWNLPGYGVSSLAGLSQTASLIGIYGLSALVMLGACVPALFWQPGSKAALRLAAICSAALLAAFVILHLWGELRIARYDDTVAMQSDPRPVRIVQAAIDQKKKWDPAHRQAIIDRHLELTRSPWNVAGQSAPLVLWPESALPLLLAEEPALLQQIRLLLPQDAWFFTGGLFRSGDQNGGEPRIYNSLMLLDPAGELVGRHDKVRLVPFGEFLPFSFILEPLGIRQLARLPGGFAAGGQHRAVEAPGLPAFSGFICYEAVFPRSVPYKRRPQFLVNVTNDAWFGTSGGPHQHLVQASFRAIEQGAPMLRAANTGISAVIDATGRIVTSLPLQKSGVLDATLPPATGITFYSRAGDAAFALLLSALTAVALAVRRPRPVKGP